MLSNGAHGGLRIGSMFSGAGGLDLAALELFPGASMAWHAEVDPAASKVLAHHWPSVPNLGDVTRIDWATVESVDILTGGFPCQDVSLAGRRAGLADGTRSGLWSHMFAAVAALRPRFVLIENVRGLLSARAIRGVESAGRIVGDRGDGPVLRALGAVLGDLSSIGFDAEWTCVRASDVGACHQRARVFVLAYPADTDSVAVREQSIAQPGSDGAAVARRHRAGSANPNGKGFQGTQSAQRRDVLAGSDRRAVELFQAPQVADATGGGRTSSGAGANEFVLPGVAQAYYGGSLLPTPRASDGTHGGPNQRGSAGDLMLSSAVHRLLPTPEAKLAHSGPDYARAGRAESGGNDLTTALAITTSRGVYEAAIQKQERRSRPAPAPTELNSKGRPRLSPAFVEWMMFWPIGYVTDPVIGLSRADQLRIIGNGVVPPQALAAFRHLLELGDVAA